MNIQSSDFKIQPSFIIRKLFAAKVEPVLVMSVINSQPQVKGSISVDPIDFTIEN